MMGGVYALDDNRKILPAKFNNVFLTLFTNPKYKDTVVLPFLRDMLSQPNLRSEDVNISDPRLPSDELEEKHPIVDVFITMSREILHIEMQFFVTKETLERFHYYHCKAFGGQLKSGEIYKALKKVMSIFFTTETAISEDNDYLHEFVTYDIKHGITMTTKSMEKVIELNKLPLEYDGTPEWIWSSLFDAEEEARLNMLATDFPKVAGAANAIKELSSDPQFRREAYLAEKAKKDWLSSIYSAKEDGYEEGILIGEQKGLIMGAKAMAKRGIPLADIASDYNQPVSVIESWVR
ncbi:MAG: Rpn family recombination-promoting nuclease/putative transposase [Oscillospiraceae bacterium]|jgi:predicted transposase/invertase (TIGR01784 family)|nr:Rpn family recombination-promoting nuclease/putative transposase [Oscillospiraceae bacterium]